MHHIGHGANMKKLIILPILIVSFVAFAESVYDQDFYASDFMNEVAEVEIEIDVPAVETAVRAVAQKRLPGVQRVSLSEKSLINGNWEVVRVLDKDLKPVYDKRANFEDKRSEIIVKLDLIKMSTVRINDSSDQTYSISLFNKKGTIALFKPFEGGYEILEARRVSQKEKVSSKIIVDKRSKIEKRFERNQELTLVSALHPTKNKDILKGSKVSGSLYLMGDQVSFDGVTLETGKDDFEALSFQAEIDGNTGHLNYENKIQGIVSVVGNKEVKVRFSTGPLAGAMLSFMVPSAIDNVEKEELQEEVAAVEEEQEQTLEERYESREVASEEDREEQSEEVDFEDVSAEF